MSTIADAFLADWQDLELPKTEPGETVPKMEEDESAIGYSKLLGSAPLNVILSGIPVHEQKAAKAKAWFNTDNKDPEYDFIVEANEMAGKLGLEINSIHGRLRDLYRKRFPELEHQVLHPLDYARVVQKLGNNIEKTQQLEEILPHANIMTISMSASSSTGTDLIEGELSEVMEGCRVALALDNARQKILVYVESRMKLFAPNLTEIIGSELAAKLIGIAGGLDTLAKLPATTLFLLGRNKKSLMGFSSGTSFSKHYGVIGECDILKKTPQMLESKIARLIGTKCTLAARVDSSHARDLNGEAGRRYRAEIERKLEKLQEPPPPRKEKPLPVPDDEPRKRRGGQRARALKDRFAMTEVHKRAMRVPFGTTPTEEYGNTMKSFGSLGMEGSGIIRANVREEKGMKLKKRLDKKTQLMTPHNPRPHPQQHGSQTVALPGGGFITSVYAMTPAQGLELGPKTNVVPEDQYASGTTSYFSHTTGFGMVHKK